MKLIIKSLLFFAAAGLVLSACKKDQTKVIVSTKNASNTLTASATSVTLDSNKRQAVAVTFTWDSVNYNVRTTIAYVLQFDIASDAFKTPVSVTAGTNVYSLAYTDSALNALAIKLGDTSSGAIQVRVLSYIAAGSDFYDSVYSNTVSVTVTPYIIYVAPLPPSSLYVVGDYMNWAWPPTGTSTADSLYSPASNGKYAGFVSIMGGTGTDQFKICKDYTYNNAFADAVIGAITTVGNVTTESMNEAGGTTNNFMVPANGNYYFEVDTNALTFKATLVNSFSVIGSATNNVAVPLTYNAGANDWTATGVSLTAGTIQFVVNNGDVSSISFGVGSAANQVANGGAGITVTAGTYGVVLNVGNPSALKDTLTH